MLFLFIKLISVIGGKTFKRLMVILRLLDKMTFIKIMLFIDSGRET